MIILDKQSIGLAKRILTETPLLVVKQICNLLLGKVCTFGTFQYSASWLCNYKWYFHVVIEQQSKKCTLTQSFFDSMLKLVSHRRLRIIERCTSDPLKVAVVLEQSRSSQTTAICSNYLRQSKSLGPHKPKRMRLDITIQECFSRTRTQQASSTLVLPNVPP